MRHFSFLLLAACLCFSVTGCGGDAATTNAPVVSAPAGGSEEPGSDAKEGEAGSEAKEAAPAE